MHFSPFHCYLVPFGQNILLTNLSSGTLSLHSSLNLSDHFPHPYKATGKIVVLCILFFKLLYSTLKEKKIALNDSKNSFNSICYEFFLKRILISSGCSQLFDLVYTFRKIIIKLYTV